MQHDIPFCACSKCRRPMEMVRCLPKIGGVPELFVFYCRDCDEVDSRNGQSNSLRETAIVH